tara:strand:- start:3524 stop:3655 length:132 start_codon:yes stop_codon:yes gene_type:complete
MPLVNESSANYASDLIEEIETFRIVKNEKPQFFVRIYICKKLE